MRNVGLWIFWTEAKFKIYSDVENVRIVFAQLNEPRNWYS